MKVLFLDHDGVICLPSEWGSRYKKKEGLDALFDRFNLKAVRVLNEIILATDCEIVVSSDWRHHCSLPDMRNLYTERGILKKPMSFTPHVKSSPQDLERSRSEEIRMWLDVHDVRNKMKWCAVDDLDMSPWLENFVITPRSSEGIKQSGVKEKIIRMLSN